MDIKNKVALVTGGANGIGFAYVKELLRHGARVAVLDLINVNGEDAVAKLNAEFGKDRAIFIPCDVTNPKTLEDSFKKTVDTFNGLDIVINNAAIMNDSQWELMINLNYTSLVRATLLGLQYMSKDKGGKGGLIVNIASTSGLGPGVPFPIYSGTKHAVIGLTRSFADPCHYGRTGVRFLTMCPGVTDTALVSEAGNKMLDGVDPKVFTSVLNGLPMQKPDKVAQGMMHIIKSAENGSTWLSEGQERPVREIKFPDRHNLEVPREI